MNIEGKFKMIINQNAVIDRNENVIFHSLSSLIILFLTGIYLVLRYPFEIDYSSVLVVTTTALSLINIPFVLFQFISRHKEINFYVLNNVAIISTLSILAVAGFLNLNFFKYPIYVLGVGSFSVTLYYYFKIINLKSIIHVILIFLLSLWLAGMVWEGRILTPLFLEKIITGFYNNSADLNYGLDNLFHMSFAQMIKTYNVPSTGLDEIPYIPYHYGSHFIFAYLSRALDISIADIYHVGFPIIFLPLFFHMVFLVYHQFKEASRANSKFDLLFWVLLFTVFIGFLPIDPAGYAFRTGMSWNSIIKSESYLISLTFLLSFLSLIVVPLVNDKKPHLSRGHLLLSIPILTIVGFCKISTLFIIDVGLGYLFLRFRLYKSTKATALVIVAMILSLFLAYLLHDSTAPSGSFHFLHFYETFIYSRFHFYIALYFFWTFALIAIWLVVLIRRIKVNTILLELQIVIAAVGFVPGLLLRVEGGSAHYFSDIQHWTSIFFIAYYSKYLFQDLPKRKLKWLYRIGLLLLIPPTLNSFLSAEKLLKDNYITKKNVLGSEVYKIDISRQELFENRSIIFHPQLNTKLYNEDFKRLKHLSRLDNQRNKSSGILFIEDEAVLSQYLPCYKLPFFLTSITGFSLLNGFSLNDCFWGGYSVEYYQDERVVDSTDLCGLVENPVFKKVVSYSIEDGSVTIINCEN